MKYLSIPVLALTVLGWATILGGCKSTQLPPATQATIAELEAQQAAQEAAGDAEGAAATEGAIAQEIADGAAETVHGILGPLSPMIPGGPLVEGALASLAWLAFPRPRKHAVRALKELNPLQGEMRPVEAVKAIGSAFGLAHSSAGTAAAFKAESENPPLA